MKPVIYTIGHSNRAIDVFIALLQQHGVQALADVRSYPGSRWVPHFNRKALEAALQKAGISYTHLKDLGGKREPVADNAMEQPQQAPVFLPGYRSYMATDAFRNAVAALTTIATTHKTAYMCSEANWQHCHRSHISDWLAKNGWEVMHIVNEDTVEPHFIRQAPPPDPQQQLF